MIEWVTKMYYLTYTSQKGGQTKANQNAEVQVPLFHLKTTSDKLIFAYQIGGRSYLHR